MHDRTADVVSGLLPQLIPAAVLLTDDPADAVRLLGTALSARRALDGPDDARRALARQVLRRPRWSAEQVVVGSTEPLQDDDTALAAALRALPERQRVAVVLEGVGSGEARAAVARLGADVARRDEDDRREREEVASRYRAPGAAPGPARPVLALPERLERLAAGRPLPPTAEETIVAAVTEARGIRRRRRTLAVAGAVVAGLLLALVPLLPQGPAAAPTVYGGPTSGSLAQDDRFLRAVAAAPWPGATTDGRRVVFAGDVPGGRWALVADGGTPTRPAAIAWFTGPSGAPADRMSLTSARTAPDPALPVALTDPATGALVVVGAPGDRIAVSERPVVGADGSITRSFRDVPATGGSAVAGLSAVPGSEVTAVRLRVVRDDRQLDMQRPAAVTGRSAAAADVPITSLRPEASSPVGDAAVESRLHAVLDQLGRTTAPVSALWSGHLPGVVDRPTRLTVLAVEQPSGAVVVTAPYAYAPDPSGRTRRSWCGTGVLPAGPPVEQRVLAVQCDFRDLTPRGEISRFLVVTGPRTATTVRLLDGAGAVLGEHAVDDGVAVVRSPGDVAEVSVTAADGSTAEAVPFVHADLAG